MISRNPDNILIAVEAFLTILGFDSPQKTRGGLFGQSQFEKKFEKLTFIVNIRIL
jgi:hypothetical protein